MVTTKAIRRHKNIGDMTIVEQLNSIATEICDTRCKYPDLCKETEEDLDNAQSMLDRLYCANCPLNRI